MLLNLNDMVGVYLVWLLSGCGLAGLVLVAWSRSRRVSVAELRCSEMGGSYSISLLMVLPLFVTLVAFFFECNQLMISNLGLNYAAYSAARSAAVWQPIDEKSSNGTTTLEERCRFAAARVLTPFSASNATMIPAGQSPVQVRRASLIASAYQQATESDDRRAMYIAKKFYRAYSATSAKVQVAADPTNARSRYATVSVTYRPPLLLPGMGRFLGERVEDADGFGSNFVRTMKATYTLPVDAPFVNNRHPQSYSIGIRYGESI